MTASVSQHVFANGATVVGSIRRLRISSRIRFESKHELPVVREAFGRFLSNKIRFLHLFYTFFSSLSQISPAPLVSIKHHVFGAKTSKPNQTKNHKHKAGWLTRSAHGHRHPGSGLGLLIIGRFCRCCSLFILGSSLER